MGNSTGLEDYLTITNKVDIWAFGLLAVFLAIGKDLYHEQNLFTMIMNELENPERSDFKYAYKRAFEAIPEYLKDDVLFDSFMEFIEKCLEHCPKDRPSAEELLKMDFITNDAN